MSRLVAGCGSHGHLPRRRTRKLLNEERLQARFEDDLLGLIGNYRDEEALEMTFEDWLRESTFLDERVTATTTFCESPGERRAGT